MYEFYSQFYFFLIFVEMKTVLLFLGCLPTIFFGQNIQGIQLFNPKTNDQTAIIALGESLVLRFDDLDNTSTRYRYTLKHYDRNWEDDGLFYSEYAAGPLNAVIEDFEFSFNTLQKYTHYHLTLPNDKIKMKISGNYEIIVYKDSSRQPVFTKRFSVYENGMEIAVRQSRMSVPPSSLAKNQRIEVMGIAQNAELLSNANSFGLTVLQNNNWQTAKTNIPPSGVMGNKLAYQQLDLAFSGNNQFFYFDNKNMNMGFDRVAGGEIIDGVNHTYLHPIMAYLLTYQYQPDVNGAYYFRRNDLGIERNADKEGDYAWVYFYLDSEPYNKEIYILGAFNEYKADEKYKMFYDTEKQQYVAKIYLKQGFYNYILATKETDGKLNFGEINGNFWETSNLYQALLYYRPFGRNYDGILGYGELRKQIR